MFPPVEQITGSDNKEVLSATRQLPVDGKHRREKNEVFERMKNHRKWSANTAAKCFVKVVRDAGPMCTESANMSGVMAGSFVRSTRSHPVGPRYRCNAE